MQPALTPVTTTTRWRGLDWPKNMPEHQRHLFLWKKWREEPYKHADLLNPVSEHVLEACRLLFTPQQLTIHPWMEVQARSWTLDEFAIWWGCAGSGKSYSMGLFALLDYLTDPDCTYTVMASTTKEMLAVRSFASVIQYLTYLKQNGRFLVPFKHIGQPMCVVPEKTEERSVADIRCKIFGVAVQQGSTEEARQNLQGVHTKYVRLLLDELSGLRPAAMEARHNLAQCDDFKVIGAANPESIYGQEGLYAEPRNGWASIDPEKSEEWESNYGKVYRFDGFKSPGLLDPQRFGFLPTREKLDRMIKASLGNEDSPAVWTFCRAWPPPQSTERTVLTENEIVAYNMRGLVTWKETPVKLAALDPAFSADGDNAVLQTAFIGKCVDGVLRLVYDKTHVLRIEASSQVPVREQIVDQVSTILTDEGISLYNFGTDDSGIQGMADAIEMKLGTGVYRANSVMKPPVLPVSVVSQETADKKYKNSITWAYNLVHDFGVFDQVRGLPDAAGRQFTLRRYLPKLRPLCLEPKPVYKKRHKHSPDEADACAILAALARERVGLLPGASEFQPGGAQPPSGGFGMQNEILGQVYNSLDILEGSRYRVELPGNADPL